MPETTRSTGAPFLRFNPITGWPLRSAAHRKGIPDLTGVLKLAIAGRSAIPLAEPKGTFGGRTLPRGLAINSSGRIFLADPRRRVIWTARVNAAHVDAAAAAKPSDAPDSWPFRPLWTARPRIKAAAYDLGPPAEAPADPYTLLGPTDVAVAPNGDLVILDPAARRILVLAFPTAVLRHVIRVAGGAPTAVCFDRHDRAYVADPGLATVHRYDRDWRHDAGFSPVPPDTPSTPSAPTFIAAAGEDGGCGGGCGGEVDARDSAPDCVPLQPEGPVVYTLDNRGTLHALYADGRMEVAADDAPPLSPRPLELVGGGTLLFHDPALPRHDPLRILGLELTGDGRHVGTGLPLMARPRRVEVPRSGHFITDALDAGVPGFAWDRIALTLEMPDHTRLVVRTMTSDSAIEPDRVEAQPESAWSRPLVLTPGDLPEVLIQSPPGRYLWLRVDLSGDGNRTPIIHELDFFGPRRSALADLPAPFHQDLDSARFLDRFLSYFDIVFAEIITRNRDVATLFDPDTTPATEGFLTWLGAWFDLRFFAEWDEATRREMIREAIPYFRLRGTVDGLRRIVQWHTGLSDPLPQILEHFRLPSGPGANSPRIGGRLLDPGNPAHSFTLVLPTSAMPDVSAKQRLNALIAASIPAHCRFQIRGFVPGVAIGSQSTIGVDTLLGAFAPAGLGQAALGSTFSIPGPETTGPVTVYRDSQATDAASPSEAKPR